MTSRVSPLRVRLGSLAVLGSLCGLAFVHGQQKVPPEKEAPKGEKKSPQAWTLNEARDQLELSPNDAYLQFVTLQLARRAKKIDEHISGEVAQLIGGGRFNNGPSTMSMFLVSLAVPSRCRRVWAACNGCYMARDGGGLSSTLTASRLTRKPRNANHSRRRHQGTDHQEPSVESMLGSVKVDPGPLAGPCDISISSNSAR